MSKRIHTRNHKCAFDLFYVQNKATGGGKREARTYQLAQVASQETMQDAKAIEQEVQETARRAGEHQWACKLSALQGKATDKKQLKCQRSGKLKASSSPSQSNTVSLRSDVQTALVGAGNTSAAFSGAFFGGILKRRHRNRDCFACTFVNKR